MTLVKKNECPESVKEWLVTNGIGGFACGTVLGIPSRKYHSYLNASGNFGRTNILNHILESITLENGSEIPLSAFQTKSSKNADIPLKSFRLELGIPIWEYEVDNAVIQKRLFFVNGQNTLHITYEVLSGRDNLTLNWRPFFSFRQNDRVLNPDESPAFTVHAQDSHYEIECTPFPLLKLYNTCNAAFVLQAETCADICYDIESARGYDSVEKLSSPGYFSCPLKSKISFVISMEPWEIIEAIPPEQAFIIEKIRKKNLLKYAGNLAKEPMLAKLILAADQFVIMPISRRLDMVRLLAMGEEVKTIIAGYPWFTDWGRDTMISLEGLTLATGRSREAYYILHTFAHYVKEGLIPNMFPEGSSKGLYHTADATLWFFHAIDRYIAYTGDSEILEFLLPILKLILQAHIKGTRFGIKVDEDGLLMQGEQGFQLTWMDAKVDDWVVTPRRGKAVEINALWYNALCLYEEWGGGFSEWIAKCRRSFNQKFWYAEGGYLYDVIEGENGSDKALRPNQLFSISLKYPVLTQEKWSTILQVIENKLLTPVGLRTLSPDHPDYKSTYDGDLRARDAAYLQGTVWPWLIGPYVDVLMKVHPSDREKGKAILRGLEQHLDENCIGTISEIFDASSPYHARGCFAQAWSVAEFLRSYLKISNH